MRNQILYLNVQGLKHLDEEVGVTLWKVFKVQNRRILKSALSRICWGELRTLTKLQ